LQGGLTDALATYWIQRDPTFRVGLRSPCRSANKAARAIPGRGGDARRIAIQSEQVEQAVEVEVRNGMQALRSRRRGSGPHIAAREYAERDYESDNAK